MKYKDRLKREMHELFQPRKLCECGRLNNVPSKAKENVARCKWCSRLIDDKARFKEELERKLRRSL